MKLGLDIDGVLADFTTDYIKVLERVSGIKTNLPPGWQPPTWHFEAGLGFTPKNVQDAWDLIEKDPDFWEELGDGLEMATYLAHWPFKSHETYHITARPNQDAQEQTQYWFMLRGYAGISVIISDQKGTMAAALELDVYVDDRLENILSVQDKSPETRAYLIDRPYNQGYVWRRAGNLEEVFTKEGL